MWLPAETVAPPTALWCSLEEAKIYLRADGGAVEDMMIEGMIRSAGAQIEVMTGLCLMPQQLALKTASFAALERLPAAPVRDVVSVEYVSVDGTALVFEPTSWRMTGTAMARGVAVKAGNSWPVSLSRAADAITVTVIAGFGVEDEIPAPLRQACFLLLGDFYLHREDSGRPLSTIPNGVMTLIANYRRFG